MSTNKRHVNMKLYKSLDSEKSVVIFEKFKACGFEKKKKKRSCNKPTNCCCRGD